MTDLQDSSSLQPSPLLEISEPSSEIIFKLGNIPTSSDRQLMTTLKEPLPWNFATFRPITTTNIKKKVYWTDWYKVVHNDEVEGKHFNVFYKFKPWKIQQVIIFSLFVQTSFATRLLPLPAVHIQKFNLTHSTLQNSWQVGWSIWTAVSKSCHRYSAVHSDIMCWWVRLKVWSRSPAGRWSSASVSSLGLPPTDVLLCMSLRSSFHQPDRSDTGATNKLIYTNTQVKKTFCLSTSANLHVLTKFLEKLWRSAAILTFWSDSTLCNMATINELVIFL